MIEKLEIVGKDIKSLTEDEFKEFLEQEIDEFFVDAPENTSEVSKMIVKLTLAMFSAQITTKLFKEEN